MKEELLELIKKEIEFSKNCHMPQFTAGLLKAKSIIEKYEEKRVGVGD
jgi:hypothetical protein